MLNIFLDTEFTNFFDTDLISIGMVAATGEEFYAEVPYPDAACSAFVREAVVPQLGCPEAFITRSGLQQRLYTWLGIVRPSADSVVQICYDYETDWTLFCDALHDRVPPWMWHANVNRHVNALMHWDFFSTHKIAEHHALNDARALKYAYRPR